MKRRLAPGDGLAASVPRETSAKFAPVDSPPDQRQIARVLPSLQAQLESELDALRRAHRLRRLPGLSDASRIHVVQDHRPLISFCSNDYLGLATHPEVQAAGIRSIAASGFGASAARLVSGDLPDHRHLETELSTFLHAEACLLFPSGYQANLGALTTLAGPDDLIVADRSVHASIIDGCRLAKAKLALYPHLDLEAADHHLRLHGASRRRRILVTETLFSMEGDIAPLRRLADIARAHDAILYVDEAHSLGTLGPGGRGLCAHYRVTPDVLIGTLGKTLGASGAFVAGPHLLIQTLLNRSRPFIFSTAQPPSVAAAARAALKITASPEGDQLRQALAANVLRLRGLLGLPPSDPPSPILPIPLGTESAALQAAQHLKAQGFFLQAIRPPTVRPGCSILRLTLSSNHAAQDIEALATALSHIPPSPPPIGAASPSTPAPTRRPVLPSSPAPSIPGLFLCGTDTSVGKTTVARALLALLARRGLRPVPFKPVQTGVLPPQDDATLLRMAAGRPDIPPHIVCPYSFPQPVAPAALPPTLAHPTLPALLQAAKTASAFGDFLVLESAGGALSPYSSGLTTLDLATAIRYPILLVTRDGLGTINHTALTIAEIRRRDLPLLGIILVRTSAERTPDQDTNSSLIEQATGLHPLGPLPFLDNPDPDSLADALERAVHPALLDQLIRP